MFFKKSYIIVVLFLAAFEIVYYGLSSYLSPEINDILQVISASISVYVFIYGLIYYVRNEILISKVEDKLKQLKDRGVTIIDQDKIDLKLLIKLISYIQVRVIKLDEMNSTIIQENKILKNKIKVYESMLEDAREKLANIHANLRFQMEVKKYYGDLYTRIERIKENIIGIISHEIRTPLFSLINYIDVLKTTIDKGEEYKELQKDIIGKIENIINRIKDVMDEIVDINNLEKDCFNVKYEKDDIVKFVKMVSQNFFNKVKNFRDLNLVFEVKENSIITYFDKLILTKIMHQLLSNAVKFTSDGGTITVGIRKTIKKNREFVNIYVKDTGIGIEKIYLEKIFNKFYEAEVSENIIATHSSRDLEFGSKGIGLGLTLVKNLVNLMNGEIWAVSEGKNKGTTFEFIIPIYTEEDIVKIEQTCNDRENMIKQSSYMIEDKIEKLKSQFIEVDNQLNQDDDSFSNLLEDLQNLNSGDDDS